MPKKLDELKEFVTPELIKEAADGFPEAVVSAAFKKCGGRCQCRNSECAHEGRCTAPAG